MSKARAKIKTLAMEAPFLNKGKINLLMNFSNLDLVVVHFLDSAKLNNTINTLHGICLCIIYNDNTSSFNELLKKDNLFSVYHKYPNKSLL